MRYKRKRSSYQDIILALKAGLLLNEAEFEKKYQVTWCIIHKNRNCELLLIHAQMNIFIRKQNKK